MEIADPVILKGREKRIIELLSAAEHVLGFGMCFHSYDEKLELPLRWRNHISQACRRNKEKGHSVCVAFDRIQTHRELVALPEGRIQTCPWGVTELAVPVFQENRMAGVLFAGPCRETSRRSPDPKVERCYRKWLLERLELVRALSQRLERLLGDSVASTAPSRREMILRLVGSEMRRNLSIRDAARLLHLSPSRAAHVVKRIFGVSFTALRHQMRLNEAARLLASTDLQIGEISAQCGYEDSNYFYRCFRKRFGSSPTAYRSRLRRMI